jgi:hypothetical protein
MKTLRTVAYIALALAYVGLGAGVYFWKEYLAHPEAGALSDLEALHSRRTISTTTVARQTHSSS